ncbi:MAG: UDP-N-acetylmuramate--L-alanine ligase [Gammaproteobacteria bacterium RIFCSPLOWO2_02_FULL_38_11]|nr:MAG: UDP-N-acetylmuramate--L-alanine ligase [Gammaproteobacteria bacterium RIFCSPHIGHO2_02_FULL_38_33]OGT23840.1 MAG: UDP-N-acetylmuramate--L-alanine ligase [Gammaproteobacteria bacterium RIFCSPHIGHO2_12_38_15]OGT69153.1 MAG: UDP-N-acetylmuramate--L-alanine ligase [Gammaproteobacteria bacterium RIFCSPLOWO2_02_FULL_38_11]OGT77291.1 MAG: UDP-N-acetylmuramate--L-alanine ligase [Gammaproteobacteria bacterium RIFCSPLOWO2_12_FULL_38_14]
MLNLARSKKMSTNFSFQPPMRRIKYVHFVGIGGAGMGGIAEVLHHEGYHISGSDIQESSMTQHLKSLGIPIYLSHDACHLQNTDVVVSSTAISADNPEILSAHEKHIPVVPRAQMLGELMRFRQGIAVAGTHGKTTTTSLITSILTEGGLDPTFVIGGLLNSVGSNARLGASPYLVAEADESDASFLHLHPHMAIVTNIDADHMSTYHGDFEKLKLTFLDFLHHLPFYGLAVLCHEDPVVQSILPAISRPMITYGFTEKADVRAKQITQKGFQTYFLLERPGLSSIEIQLNLPGLHNVLNALAAITIATEIGVSDETLQTSLLKFEGVGRRLQRHGEITLAANKKALLIDDYGHHPREITATLQAIRQAWPHRRIVMAYQPHRYTRTRDLFEDFTQVLSDVDQLLLLDVYSAGETPIPGADSRALCRAIRNRGQIDPIFIESKEVLIKTLARIIQDNDILLIQGAGNIGNIAPTLTQHFHV